MEVDPLSTFSAPTRAWFERTFAAPSPAQALGWPAIARGEHTLLLAPTGSGKTLAAFLYCIDRVASELAAGQNLDGVQVLYISPLKALSNDVHRNLEAPLAGIRAAAGETGLEPPAVLVGLRTGDTPARERVRLVRQPPHVLVTTPESLYLMLTSRAREGLRSVRWVIVDEIHALAPNKRGVHLALSLERLEALAGRAPVRIGLSATQRPLEEIANFLGGGREVTILDAKMRKQLELQVVSPVDDLRKLPDASIWPAYPPFLVEQIQRHRTTLVFVNNRRSAERLCTLINDAVEQSLARVHHGAMSRRAREEVEGQLKAGVIAALVCTSSLELGIDMGAIDLVIQIESAGGVARALQRVGRAGHSLDAPSRGVLLPKFRGDLAECAALVDAMEDGAVEPTHVPERCLDVLAQQIVAMAAVDAWSVADLLAVLKRAWPYRNLTMGELEAVLEMLGGRYPAEEFAELRPRVVWDRIGGKVRGRPGALRLAVTSGGTIADRGLYPVELGVGGPRLGELDEEFVFESRVGDVFQLGTGTWRIENIGTNRITVAPAPGEPPRLPFWRGEGPGRTVELGEAVGALHRRWEADPAAAPAWLRDEHRLDQRAVENLCTYLAEQRQATGLLPTDRRVVVEHFPDESGDLRIAIHLPLGPSVNTPLGILLSRRLAEVMGSEPSWLTTGDGLLFRISSTEAPPPDDPLALLFGLDVDAALLALLGETTLFGARFRENAARALLLPRRMPGQRTPLYLQRLRAQDLLEVARKHPEFPVLVETYRECLRDVWNLPRLRALLDDLEAGKTEVAVRNLTSPSPFARSMLFFFAGSFMYESDLPRAERRAQLLPVHGLLSSVLGEGELRQLIDPVILVEEEARASRTAPLLRARNPDELHDRLLSLGPLSDDEMAARTVEPQPARAFLDELRAAGRALPLGDRWIAAEDAPRYANPDESLVRRALKAGGPATVEEVAHRAALDTTFTVAALEKLAARGEAQHGHFRPDSEGEEWVDPKLLERLRRRSLAAARRAVRPVEPARHGQFLLAWQHLAPSARQQGPGGLERAMMGLYGFALPSEIVEKEILARRVRGYEAGWLDRRISDGEWAFSGAGAAGRLRVAFWPRADLPLPPESAFDPDSVEGRVIAHLSSRGASFFSDLWHATELEANQLGDALWALLLAGVVSNDRFEPVRRGRQAIGPDRTGTRARPAQLRPAGAGGRWSIVGALPSDPLWWAERLLDRYGVVSREHVEGEAPPVPWRDLLDVYKALELRGEVRRGYFVEGLSGTQFAWPVAVEELRADTPPSTIAISACDPVCVAGPLLPPDLARLPSNFIVIQNGTPVMTLETGARRLRRVAPLDGDDFARALEALTTVGGALEVAELDGDPAPHSPLAPSLRAAGFEPDGDRLRRSPLQVRPLP